MPVPTEHEHASSSHPEGDLRQALDPIASTSFSQRLSNGVSSAISNPFTSSNATKVFTDLAPALMTSRMINATTASSSRNSGHSSSRAAASSSSNVALGFSLLSKAPSRISLGARRVTSRELEVSEATPVLLAESIPGPSEADPDISLLRGFNATNPSSEQSKLRRRKMRHIDTPHLGLKQMTSQARGLLTDEPHSVPNAAKGRISRGRQSLSASVKLGHIELRRQTEEIAVDQQNLAIRRRLIKEQMDDIDRKTAELRARRQQLESDLLGLHEDELELEDELAGVQHRIIVEESEDSHHHSQDVLKTRRGPAFVPAEHDDLPPGVAFMSLSHRHGSIVALDFSEPYGILVSSSDSPDDGYGARVWDLANGEELGRLRASEDDCSVTKCAQVEGGICITGGSDSRIRVWDLHELSGPGGPLTRVDDDGEVGLGLGRSSILSTELHGHSGAISSLYFDESCLVSGASDKTLRQWDLTTGQCVLTMDILWAISHPSITPASLSSSSAPRHSILQQNSTLNGPFSVPAPPASDGSWDMYEDFVGSVQFWGFALVSGSGDSAVRMWDMRTGQSHRTLIGHSGPVTCLQFDEHHIVSGSLDKTIRIWDLRAGGNSEILKFDYPVTSLQFDSRKIVAAAGENGIKVYNRTTMQTSTLLTNGHSKPCQRVRYMDRYLVSGGRDGVVKTWAL